MRSIFIGDNIEPVGLDEYSRWSAQDIPILLDFDLIVAELPVDDHSRISEIETTLFQEILLARKCGTTVVWIISPHSGTKLLKLILDVPVFRLRSAAMGSAYTVNEHAFERYFSTVSGYSHLFEPPRDWHPIAFVRNPSMSLAAFRKHRDEGLEVIMPADLSATSDSVSLVCLMEACMDLKTRTYRTGQSYISIVKPILFILLLAISISVARYNQRRINIRLLESSFYYNPISISYTYTNYAGFLTRFKPSEFDKPNKLILLKTMSIEKLDDYLELADKLGFYGLEARMASFLIDNYKQNRYYLNLMVRHLDDRVYQSIFTYIGQGAYENARFRAQRYLNYAYALRSGRYYDKNNSKLNEARRVVELISCNYPYGPSDLIHQILGTYHSRLLHDDEDEIRFSASDIDESLFDNVAYAGTKKAASAKKALEQVELWRKFIRNHPKSEKLDEACLNVINALLESYKENSNVEETIRLNRLAIRECDSLVDTFPKSYLADDALRYILKAAFSVGNTKKMYSAFIRLVKEYPDADSTLRVLYRIDRWQKTRYGFAGNSELRLTNILRRSAYQTASMRLEKAIPFAFGGGKIGQSCLQQLEAFMEIPQKQLLSMTCEELITRLLTKWLEESDERVTRYKEIN